MRHSRPDAGRIKALDQPPLPPDEDANERSSYENHPAAYYAVGVKEAPGNATPEEYFKRLQAVHVVPICVHVMDDRYNGYGNKYVRIYCTTAGDAETAMRLVNGRPRGRERAVPKPGQQPPKDTLDDQKGLFERYIGLKKG